MVIGSTATLLLAGLTLVAGTFSALAQDEPNGAPQGNAPAAIAALQDIGISADLRASFPVTTHVLIQTGNRDLAPLLAKTLPLAGEGAAPNAGITFGNFAGLSLIFGAVARWNDSDIPTEIDGLSATANGGNPTDFALANAILLTHMTAGTDLGGFGDIAAAGISFLNSGLAEGVGERYNVAPVGLGDAERPTFESSGVAFQYLVQEHLRETGALAEEEDIRRAHDGLEAELNVSSLGAAGEIDPNEGLVRIGLPVFSPEGLWRESQDLMSFAEQQGGDIGVIAAGDASDQDGGNGFSGSDEEGINGGASVGETGTGTDGDEQSDSSCTFQQEQNCSAAAQITIQTPYLTMETVGASIEFAAEVTATPWRIQTSLRDFVDDIETAVNDSEALRDKATNACMTYFVDCGPKDSSGSEQPVPPGDDESPPGAGPSGSAGRGLSPEQCEELGPDACGDEGGESPVTPGGLSPLPPEDLADVPGSGGIDGSDTPPLTGDIDLLEDLPVLDVPDIQ